MGVVYEAVHTASKARVALKRLDLAGLDDEARLRFQREAEALAKLDHPAIVRVHAASFEGPPYLVQDFLPGGSLAARLRADGPLPCDEARALVQRLGEGLQHAHARGVLHRDLKPANVVFDERGQACLTDFGLAGLRDVSKQLTRTGEVMGTPSYMAPEQAQDAKRVDARADVYGLGAILFACLTGRGPFDHHRGVVQILNAVIHHAPPPVRSLRPDAPAALAAACERALAKAPARRFQDVASLLHALDARAPRRPVWPLALVGAAVVVGGLSAVGRAPAAPTPLDPVASPAAAARDPLEDALLLLEGEGAVTRDLEREAALALAGAGGRGAVISRLSLLPRSAARDALLATGLVLEGRLEALRGWEGGPGHLGGALLRVEDQRAALSQTLEQDVVRVDLHELRAELRELIESARVVPSGPASAWMRQRVQHTVARGLAALALRRQPAHHDLYEAAVALVGQGTGRSALELAHAYALARRSAGVSQAVIVEHIARGVVADRFDPRRAHWRAVAEARLRIRGAGTAPWRADPRTHERVRSEALNRILDPTSSLPDAYRTDNDILGVSVALDLLWEAWATLRASEGREGGEAAKRARAVLPSGSRTLLDWQVEVAACLLQGEAGSKRVRTLLLSFETEEELGLRWLIMGQIELLKSEWNLGHALDNFESALNESKRLGDDIPVEALVGRLHVRVLQGELSVEEALRHPDLAKAARGDFASGHYWHFPDFFEDTLRGAWWPGRKP
jgi:hypothetical protein